MALELLTVRRMTIDDIEAVADLERRAFEVGWPPTAFRREIVDNRLAHYLVLERTGPRARILGFVGLWAVVDQAHIVTVAVDPDSRGQGFGNALVYSLMCLARSLGLTDATLECRVSNVAARKLYRRFGFHDVGERRAYYADGEDAVIMTSECLVDDAYEARLRERAARLRSRSLALELPAEFEVGAGREG